LYFLLWIIKQFNNCLYGLWKNKNKLREPLQQLVACERISRELTAIHRQVNLNIYNFCFASENDEQSALPYYINCLCICDLHAVSIDEWVISCFQSELTIKRIDSRLISANTCLSLNWFRFILDYKVRYSLLVCHVYSTCMLSKIFLSRSFHSFLATSSCRCNILSLSFFLTFSVKKKKNK
jgi:hypothetical protein